MPILNLKKTEDQADNQQERSDQINANLTVIKVCLEKGEDARLTPEECRHMSPAAQQAQRKAAQTPGVAARRPHGTRAKGMPQTTPIEKVRGFQRLHQLR